MSERVKRLPILRFMSNPQIRLANAYMDQCDRDIKALKAAIKRVREKCNGVRVLTPGFPFANSILNITEPEDIDE